MRTAGISGLANGLSWTARAVGTVAVGLALGTGAAGAQNAGGSGAGAAISDAQVEANVLRALAGAPELSTQNIQTTTVYGVVTLSGSTTDEAARRKAENLAARASGVKKVVDELTLGAAAAAAPDATADPGKVSGGNVGAPPAGMVLQSDGTYAPAPAAAAPDAGQGAAQLQASAQQMTEQGTPAPAPTDGASAGGSASAQAPPPAVAPRRPMYGGGPYSNGPYGGGPYNNGTAYPMRPVEGGQVAGKQVTVPTGSLMRIRINQGLSTRHAKPGEIFDGTVLNDVVADGAVAIPRGAAVQGTVVSVQDAGALKGRGELALQLNKLTMGGQTYAMVSDTWLRNGRDKSLHTVNSALGLGAVGALFGAVAGGGEGAAIGAGVGAVAGVASSASSPDGKVIIPPEAVLTFHLTQAVAVATVSEQEMARLSYAAGPGGQGPPPVVRRRYYPEPYYAPGPYYYPRY